MLHSPNNTTTTPTKTDTTTQQADYLLVEVLEQRGDDVLLEGREVLRDHAVDRHVLLPQLLQRGRDVRSLQELKGPSQSHSFSIRGKVAEQKAPLRFWGEGDGCLLAQPFRAPGFHA